MTAARQRETVFVLGASGMLGSAIFRVLAADERYDVRGVVRDARLATKLADQAGMAQIVSGFEACDPATLEPIIAGSRTPTVVNCVGLVKQLAAGNSVLEAAPVNTLLPHRLVELVRSLGGRVIHFSTDCVFSGERGRYRETDCADARDVYGLTKYLGEVSGPKALTLRTSIIGHGVRPNASLVDWFLSQPGPVMGFTRAIFSGLPTIELARILRDHVLPRGEMAGLYHVSSEPIDKYTLLTLVRDNYGLSTSIVRSAELAIDRSLDSSRFRSLTGWEPKPWSELVAEMHRDFLVRPVRED